MHPPPLPPWANFTLMMEYTSERSRCYSVYSVVRRVAVSRPPVDRNCVHTKPCGCNYLNKLSEGLNLRDLGSSGVEPEVIIAYGWLIGPTGPELYTRNSGVGATLLPHPGTIFSAG